MGMTFPGRVIALTEVGVLIECQDHTRRASTLLLPDITVGECVAVAAGTVIGRLSPHEAAELRAAIEGATDMAARPAPRRPLRGLANLTG